MVRMSVAILLLLVMTNGQYPSLPTTCNYVIVEDANPGIVVAVDVCRTYNTSGVMEYRKYVCDNPDTIKDEVYDGVGCTGNVIPETPTNVSAFNCSNYGGYCEYIMLKYCEYAPDTYTIEPIITKTCAAIGFHSYIWNCSEDGSPGQIRWLGTNFCDIPANQATMSVLSGNLCVTVNSVGSYDALNNTM
eukprot:UN12409